jgi:ribosomal protein S21
MPAIIQGCPYVVASGSAEPPPAGQIAPRGGDCRDMRVELREGEGFDQLFRRFTKGIERSGIIREHRRGLRFISVQEENRAKRRKAERRRRRNATT